MMKTIEALSKKKEKTETPLSLSLSPSLVCCCPDLGEKEPLAYLFLLIPLGQRAG
jgi:hypothetical protein